MYTTREVPTTIYNVLVCGVSIGMTFSLLRAEEWLRDSMSRGEKEIRAVRYQAPHDSSVVPIYAS